jgi:hypothetical protein
MLNNFYEHIIAFHESRHYRPRVEVAEARPDPGDLRVLAEDAGEAARLMAYFDNTTIDRAGTLLGEYLFLPDLHLLVDRRGVCMCMSSAADDYNRWKTIEVSYRKVNLVADLPAMLAQWDRWPQQQSPALLLDIYRRNYFDFSMELITRQRFLAGQPQGVLLLQADSLDHLFQRDLLAHTIAGWMVAPVRGGIRVRDPECMFARMTTSGMTYLRDTTRIRAKTGGRRLYLRRASRNTRQVPGGGVVEDAAFLRLIADYGFETVSFGDGERRVAEQVALLEGAGIVLAPHGAAMTNLAYLDGPATIIELMGPRDARGFFMHVSAVLGLRHRVLFSSRYDVDGDLKIDSDLLRDLLADVAGVPAQRRTSPQAA